MIFKTGEKKSEVKNGISRFTLTWIAFLGELFLIIFIMLRMTYDYVWMAMVARTVSVIVALGMYSQNRTYSLKITWIIFILAFPVAGLTVYFLVGLSGAPKRMKRRYQGVLDQLIPLLIDNEEAYNELKKAHPHKANVSKYIHRRSGYPLYNDSEITYFSDTNDALDAQLEALSGAKKYIFMEYYAIQESGRWNEIYEVLLKKKKQGVEIRVFYDDVGSLKFIDSDFTKMLEADGIKCSEFNHVTPVWSFFFNNRDHRKMTIVDGEIAFTGGYNLADEYFNITHPYGLWKDSGIRIKGPAARSMAVTFLCMWNATVNKGELEDVTPFLGEATEGYESTETSDSNISQIKDSYTETELSKVPQHKEFDTKVSEVKESNTKSSDTDTSDDNTSNVKTSKSKAYIQPYADSPMDHELVGEDVYISLIDSASEYIWFVTPYLIMTEEMIHALSLAAKRGVDVRIIMPGIPDKKTIYGISRSYYQSVMSNGVRIFEYKPGFCHAKMCVTDDVAATCGSINLDYRSLVHHFENGCMFMECEQVLDVKKDFEDMFDYSDEVLPEYIKKRKSHRRLWQLILRLIAPLL